MIRAALVVCLVACAPGRLRGEPAEDRPGLYALLTPRDASGRFELARARFDRAAADYRRGQYRAAADGFMAAAALLRYGGAEVETLRADREWIYANAAAAFSVAKQPAAGRTALTAAVTADPPCADVLRRLLDELQARERE